MTDGRTSEQGNHPGHPLQNTRPGDRGGAADYCQPRGQHQQAQKSGELVDCPQQAAMVAETPLGSRRVVDCSQQAAMVAETPLGSRRVVNCSQQAAMAAKSSS